MAGEEQKRRRLRLSDTDATKNTAFLYNFDNGNLLLHENGRIRIDDKSPASSENLYVYFGDASVAPPPVIGRNNEIRYEPAELPRRRRRNLEDPLNDHVYETFHRRMKKDERSRTLTDRARMYFEMDNLKTQLELLEQHDWNKHLPQITILKDRSDVDELLAKRLATMREIKKTLAKFASWEARCNAHAREVKEFDARRRTVLALENDDDADDADESILDVPLEELAKKRRIRRLEKHGRPIRILLGNGCSIRYNPYLTPLVAVEHDMT